MATTNSSNMYIDQTAFGLTKPVQPCFYAYLSVDAADVTGDGTAWTATLDSTKFNIGNCFNIATYTFTAPIAGIFLFGCKVTFKDIPAVTYALTRVATTAGYTVSFSTKPNILKTTTGLNSMAYTCFTPMTAGQTATLSITGVGSTKTMDISSGNDTYMWGCMLS